MISWMSFKFGQMGPLSKELAALERLKVDVSTLFWDEFESQPNPTTDC